jgi:hypothetical protein
MSSSPDSDEMRVVSERADLFECPYHEALFRKILQEGKGSGQEFSPMERFLQNDASQQNTLFVRPDNELSRTRRCTCKTLGEKLVIMDGIHD